MGLGKIELQFSLGEWLSSCSSEERGCAQWAPAGSLASLLLQKPLPCTSFSLSEDLRGADAFCHGGEL